MYDDQDILNYKESPIHIDDVITSLVAQQAHFSDHLDRCWDDLDPEQLARLLLLYGQNASRLGRLLRDRYALYRNSYEELQTWPTCDEVRPNASLDAPLTDDDTFTDEYTDDDDHVSPQDGTPTNDVPPQDSTPTNDVPPYDVPPRHDPDAHVLPVHIDDVISALAAKQARLSHYLDSCWQDPDADHLDRLLAVYSQNAIRLGRLLRDRAVVYGPPPDPKEIVLIEAYEVAGAILGIDLMGRS